MLLLFIGIRNAWDVVTYTAFERRLWIHRRRQPLTGSAKRLRSTTVMHRFCPFGDVLR